MNLFVYMSSSAGEIDLNIEYLLNIYCASSSDIMVWIFRVSSFKIRQLGSN